MHILTHPSTTLAHGIEDLIIYGHKSSFLTKSACELTARAVSATIFPSVLAMELAVKRIPKMVLAAGTDKYSKKSDKALKFLLSIIPSAVFGLYCPEGMPGFFLKKRPNPFDVRPFGVETVFGTRVVNAIQYPKTIAEVQQIVRKAKQNKSQISVIGAGMSQGTQTVPKTTQESVLHTHYLNDIQIDAAQGTVTVGAGATWEQVQIALDKEGKSAIVKQASDIFSIGGSIGINCHGWAHQYGAIASTVRSLKVIDADGNLRSLPRPKQGVALENLTDDEKLFKCMFGTLGYFGIIVEATLDIVDNETLIESTEEITRDQFAQKYAQIQQENVPLFGGRLVLDTLEGDPLRNICMVSYRKSPSSTILDNRRIALEPKWGTRVERIGLKAISHFSNFVVKRLISHFWNQEKAAMFSGRVVTRNEALHPPINAFNILHHSDLHAQWLQEYFVEPGKLANFLRFLGAELKANDVRLINATIRPTPKDEISILPYAEKDRCAVVICFAQRKSDAEMDKTRKWIENVNNFLTKEDGIFYQAYMPYATKEQFETAYGKERVQTMRILKKHFDPENRFGNAHTAKYYDSGETL
jgi:FAD/FMN-containing dehydrogenase